MPRFDQAASFFEERAKKGRSPDDQKLLSEIAQFYRKLATITPGSPPGLSETERWKSSAEECRAIAAQFVDSECRAHMLRLADTYDQLGVEKH